MEFLKDIGNSIMTGLQNIGNWFSSNFGGGGSSFSAGPSTGANFMGPPAPSLSPITPASPTPSSYVAPVVAQSPSSYGQAFMPSQAPLYPTPATNPHAVNSMQNQVMGELTYGARRLLSGMGTAGQILTPIVDSNLRVIDATQRQNGHIAAAQAREAAWQANANGALSMHPPGMPPGPPVNVRGQFGGASGGALSERLIQARHDGAQAMVQRGINEAITIAGTKALNGVYTPKSNGGVFGDAMNRIFHRR